MSLIAVANEELAARAQRGDREAFEELLKRCEIWCRHEARSHQMALDLEDRIQEARITAMRAIQAWDERGGSNFQSFVKTCIRRRFVDIVRAIQARLSGTLSLDLDDDDNGKLAEPTARDSSDQALAELEHDIAHLDWSESAKEILYMARLMNRDGLLSEVTFHQIRRAAGREDTGQSELFETIGEEPSRDVAMEEAILTVMRIQRVIVDDLIQGRMQKEIAENRQVSQRLVSDFVKAIRSKLLDSRSA